MTRFKRWQDGLSRHNRRIAVQLALFLLCCLAAVLVRRLVAADAVGDLAAVLLEFGALAAFLGAVVVTIVAARGATGGPERIVLRVAPIALAFAGATFVTSSYADVSVALQALTSGGDDAPTSIVVGPGGRDVRLSGTLTEGASKRLSDLLNAHPKVERIHLTSDGGLVDEGEALRKLIGAHRLTTFVPDYCVSACTLAFLGGRERLIMTDARLGFHMPYEEGLFGQTFQGDKSAERAAYVSAGVTPAFVDRALEVAPDDIWTPAADRLRSAHVITGVVDRYRFPDSNLDGIADLAGARATVLRNFPLAKALALAEPGAVDAIAGSYLAAYRDGLSEGDVVDRLRSVLAAAAVKVIARGDDDTIIAFGRYLDDAMEAAESDEDCVAIGAAADLSQAEETLDRGDGKAGQLAVALLSRASKTRQTVQFARSTDAGTISAALHKSGGACASIRGVYEGILRLPRHAAADELRTIVATSEETLPLSLVAH